MGRNADVSLQLISFSKGRSESVVQKLEGDEALEQHKTQRLKEKSESGALDSGSLCPLSLRKNH